VRKASLVLGIVGGAVDAVIGLAIFAYGPMLGGLAGRLGAGAPGERSAQIISAIAVAFGLFVVLTGVLAIVGGVVVRKNPVLGGILMLLAALPNFLLRFVGILVGLALVVGGVLAFMREKPEPSSPSSTPPSMSGD